MRTLAPETIKEQIEELAPDWDDGLCAWQAVNGEVHIAATRPVRVPLHGLGIHYVDDLVDPIAPIGADYPISAAMRNRVKRWEREPWRRFLERRAAKDAQDALEMEAVDRELKKDIGNVLRERIWLGVGT